MANYVLPPALTAAQLQEINEHLTALHDLLAPLYTALNVAEIRALVKMGEKSIPFVQDALVAAQNNGGTLPADFSTPQFAQALSVYTQLAGIALQLKQMETGIGNTATVAGSVAMSDANQAYGYFKTGARTNAALKPIVTQLAERYKQSRAKDNSGGNSNSGNSG